ncbi:MAG: methionyl-tRNA formyltransferase, partial [Patescibacteria group bacterium]
MNPKIAYFGGEPLSVPVLNELKQAGILPELVVCSPDRPVGRKQALTPPPTKVWAQKHGIEAFQPVSYKEKAEIEKVLDDDFDLFVVVAYNFILPEWVLELPKHKTINVHPSLLPKLRGPSPIRSAIANDDREAIGVSVMLLDNEMDHGPLLAQQVMPIADEYWPIDGQELDKGLANLGGALLADTIPQWLTGKIEPTEQAHDAATYTEKLTRADGELALNPHNLPTSDAAFQALLKIRAFSGWPETFFVHEGKRVKIKEAEL